MVKYDIHFFTSDAVPLLIQFLKDKGIKLDSHRSVSFTEVRSVESLRTDNCVTLKVKYHV